MRFAGGISVVLGVAMTAFGLIGSTRAAAPYCNGTVGYDGSGGWSFGCEGDCPPGHDCGIQSVPTESGYNNVCTCGPWVTACCNLVGVVTVVPGQQSTIQPAKGGQCDPPITACPAGQCVFVVTQFADGSRTVTAECR